MDRHRLRRLRVAVTTPETLLLEDARKVSTSTRVWAYFTVACALLAWLNLLATKYVLARENEVMHAENAQLLRALERAEPFISMMHKVAKTPHSDACSYMHIAGPCLTADANGRLYVQTP